MSNLYLIKTSFILSSRCNCILSLSLVVYTTISKSKWNNNLPRWQPSQRTPQPLVDAHDLGERAQQDCEVKQQRLKSETKKAKHFELFHRDYIFDGKTEVKQQMR